MQRILGMILIAFLTTSTFAQTEPTNCAEEFDHTYTPDQLLIHFQDDDIRFNLTKASKVFWTHPELTIDYVYSTLNHQDWQARQIICREIWRRIDNRLPGFTITPNLA